MVIRDHLWPFVFNNEVPFLFSIQDEIDDVVDVANVDLAVIVCVGGGCTSVARIAAHDNNVNHTVSIGDINLPIAIHVTRNLKQGWIVAHALIYDFAILDDVAQTAILLVVGIGVRLTGERRQQVTHVTAVKADAFDHIAHRVPILLHIGIPVTIVPINYNWFSHYEVLIV